MAILEVILRNFDLCTAGLAWDWINQKLYWTDYCYRHLEVYDPSTQDRNVLFNGLSSPRGIVVDPTTGYVFIP